jgi:hypothetical protein
MDRKLIATLFVLFTVQGCASAGPDTRAESSLIAMGPTTGPLPGASPAPPVVERIPDDVLHDPAARFALTERLRAQIVARTRGDSDDRYWNEVRPRLRRQIESAGLPRADVDLLLAEVDQARAAR